MAAAADEIIEARAPRTAEDFEQEIDEYIRHQIGDCPRAERYFSAVPYCSGDRCRQLRLHGKFECPENKPEFSVFQIPKTHTVQPN